MKTCSKCKETKPYSDFVKNSQSPDGHFWWCKDCQQAYHKARYISKPRKKPYCTDTEKQCSRCKQIKPLDAFYKNKKTAGGVSCICKACQHKDDIKRSRRNGHKPAKVIYRTGTHRECPKCGQIKPYSDFSKNKGTIDGYTFWCKKCLGRYRKQKRREQGIDPPRELYRSETHKECGVCAEIKAYSEYHRDKSTIDGYRRVCKECQKAWAKSPEGKARQAKYHRKWRQGDKGKASNARRHARRRQRLKDTANDLTDEQWQVILEIFDNRCAYCGFVNGELHRDHVVPLTQGGDLTVGNVVPACTSCNQSKHNNNVKEWMLDKGYDYQAFEVKWGATNHQNLRKDRVVAGSRSPPHRIMRGTIEWEKTAG